MKQNELFNKCCENIDPKTREEVWKQMDKELGRTELEQAAKEYAKINDNSSITNGFSIVKFAAFKAGAEWQKKQICKDCPNRGNTHSYLQGYEDGEEEGYRCGKDELERGYKKKYKAAVRRVAAVISKKERERFSKKLEEIKEEFI